eukprot:CAMPEP_0116137656 /NCGR_PEP_ID=MMETSP0329-20121206/12360_1 /TAXON_ID=697910 /ORGANISM="Pseudo-nitzschia arenysensis, Strain B593" /LENGTH=417 /DNA_ID=CAMNT_0003632577 /DNA_START=55 /DNA_END=1308 /DNA_ORIENTATION=-
MTSIECQEQIYKVPLSGDNETNTTEYVLRGLREDEIRLWSEFCASVFSYKKNPPPSEYFYRHYANDPTTKVPGSSRLIRVALFEGTIVASCRVFLKDISSGTTQQNVQTVLRSGGIGEVCTDVKHRRRGISKKLLENAIAIMEERSDVQISSLHAAPTFFPLYQLLGYSAPPISNPSGGNRWSTVDFCWKPSGREMTNNDSEFQIRPAEFPRDTEILQKLHEKYSEENLAGCILRSQEYWNKYLSKELEGFLFVLVSKENLGKVLSWLSLKACNGGDLFCVQEFGIDLPFLTETKSLTIDQAVTKLVSHAIEDHSLYSSSVDPIICSVKLPGFVSDEIRSCQDSNKKTKNEPLSFAWESEQMEIDRGWMYRGVGNSGTTITDEFLDFIQGTVATPREEIAKQQLRRREHFVWPSDSF